MRNISGKYHPVRMLLCPTMGLRSAFVVSASTRAGTAIAGALLSAAIICGAPAAAAEEEGTPSIMPSSPSAKFCVKSSEPGGKEVCFTGSGILQEANEGPPTDPNVFEEQQKKLQEDLQKRADELRKKLESQGGTGPSAPLRKGLGLLPPCLPNC
jgi:hypothetical protein